MQKDINKPEKRKGLFTTYPAKKTMKRRPLRH